MKKMISLALALAMGLSLAACSGKDAKNTEPTSDLAYVQDKGTLVVGITEFEPMDYQDENGNWVGFDADMATLFAESLGVDVEFQLIDWDSKIMELDGKTIDVAWNGMTLTDEVISAVERGIAKVGAVSAKLDQGISPLDLLHEVLGEFELEVLETTPVEYRCQCSRERVSRALISMGKNELESLIQDQGSAELTCQFCDKVYHFLEDELKQLLLEATS